MYLPSNIKRLCKGITIILLCVVVIVIFIEPISASYYYTDAATFNRLLTVSYFGYVLVTAVLTIAIATSVVRLLRVVREVLGSETKPEESSTERMLMVVHRQVAIVGILGCVATTNCVMNCTAMGAFRDEIWAIPGLSLFFQVSYLLGPTATSMLFPFGMIIL